MWAIDSRGKGRDSHCSLISNFLRWFPWQKVLKLIILRSGFVLSGGAINYRVVQVTCGVFCSCFYPCWSILRLEKSSAEGCFTDLHRSPRHDCTGYEFMVIWLFGDLALRVFFVFPSFCSNVRIWIQVLVVVNPSMVIQSSMQSLWDSRGDQCYKYWSFCCFGGWFFLWDSNWLCLDSRLVPPSCRFDEHLRKEDWFLCWPPSIESDNVLKLSISMRFQFVSDLAFCVCLLFLFMSSYMLMSQRGISVW